MQASVIMELKLLCGLWDLPRLGIELLSLGRQIFNHWTTREEQNNSFLNEAMKAQRG